MARFAGQPIRRKPQAAASKKDDAKEAEVSEPGEPAEQEADAVADEVADKLHGDAKGGEHGTADAKDGEALEETAGAKEEAPEIGAKLEGVGRKIYAARDKRDPTTPREDKRPIPNSVGTQEGAEIQIKPGALDHVLRGHTVENFDPVARLAEVGPGTDTSLFPPGFATNAQEIVTVVKQALGNKAARNFAPADRQLEVTLKKVKLQIWVGPVGKSQPGAYMLNSVFPQGGVTVSYKELQQFAADVKAKKKTVQQVRADLVGRFKS